MKSIIFFAALCLVADLVSSAPTEDPTTTTTPATPVHSEPRATAAGGNMVTAHAHLTNSSFTCLNRQVGYYADVDTDCKVYHFCMLGEFNGQEVYQRVSYMCVNDTSFDQQALDCVETAKMNTTCPESSKFFDSSNAALRQAVVGQANTEATTKQEAEKKMETKKEEDKKKEDKEDEKREDEKKGDEKKDEDDKKDEKKDD